MKQIIVESYKLSGRFINHIQKFDNKRFSSFEDLKESDKKGKKNATQKKVIKGVLKKTGEKK